MPADQNEYGPFNSEREALDTRAAAVLKAAYDEHPGVGAGNRERADLLTAACEAAGVVLGDYDLRLLRWLANWENGQCVSLAGIIHRAYEAGKAAGPDGTVTEWGVRLASVGGHNQVIPEASEEVARNYAAVTPLASDAQWFVRVVRREIGPWTPADEPATRETGEGNA